jgi:deoxyribonuclease-4
MWKPSQYAPEVLETFREAQAAHPSVRETYCHATYLINLASPNPELYAKSVDCLVHNLSVGRGMASSGVILHVGSHLGGGFDEVIDQIAAAFRRALDEADAAPDGVADCPILIENAAGAGGTVGRSFDEIAVLIDACRWGRSDWVCAWTRSTSGASGYDYTSIPNTEAVIAEIDRTVGLERLRCLHLNDSKTELGANRDRHANLGEGTIGFDGLAPLLGHPAIRDLPLLLEVPGDGDGPRAGDVALAGELVRYGVSLYDDKVVSRPNLRIVPSNPAPEKKKSATSPAKKTAATKVADKKAAAEEGAGEQDRSQEGRRDENFRYEDGRYEGAHREEECGEEDDETSDARQGRRHEDSTPEKGARA